MPLTLRPYQQEAVEKAVAHFRTSDAPACVVLPTGAGKSLVIAELARQARGRVLILAHVKELCEQNHAKYLALGDVKPAGLFSAGLGEKNASTSVTFGSVQSVARNLDDFEEPISILIIDECHRLSDDGSTQYGQVIEHLRKTNERHRAPTPKILGLTATPYRLGMGWTYRQHAWGFVRTSEERPFERCVYEVTLRQMVDAGYLTQPLVEDAPIAQYDFDALSSGRFGAPASEVNALLVKHSRVTESIIEQVRHLADEQSRQGVMIFAATVEHAKEIASYLPDEETALILGETTSEQRDEKVRAFVEQKLRYLVNVSVLTTGFDAPHVDLIAILRPTESVSLFQQIVGRGLRLFDGKKDCLVIDYAGNGYDVFSPEVGEKKPSQDSVVVPVECPECGFQNQFWGLTDGEGHVVEHYGRRCHGTSDDDEPKRRCTFRFRFKECDKCGAENDIAARSCSRCARPIVDPDEQLKEALRLKDGMVLRVSGMTLATEGSRLKITYHDEDGASINERFDFDNAKQTKVFNKEFGRRLASGRRPLELEKPEHALQLQGLLPTPDFVVARKQKKGRTHWFRVEARLFDYEGRRRTAVKAG